MGIGLWRTMRDEEFQIYKSFALLSIFDETVWRTCSKGSNIINPYKTGVLFMGHRQTK